MKWTNKGHQFDDIAKVVCDDESEYYIWGAGVFGESFYHVFKDEIRVKGFVDSNPKKWGATIGNVRVSSPQILVPKSAHVKVLVSAGWIKEIFGELERMGYSLNCDFFHIDEFSSIYMMYRHDRLCLTNISYIITEKCTLKCEKCSGLYP
jgi:FlaA1/EpsC-like NDP-sugar epimerase